MESPLQMSEVIDRSGHWLLKQQLPGGGWGERPGKEANALNTAETMIALLDARLVDTGDEMIHKAANFLLASRIDEKPDLGAWPRECHARKNGPLRRVPDLLRSACALQALIKSGRTTSDRRIKESLDWLMGRQNNEDHDLGWGYRRGAESHIIPSCHALQALLLAYHAGARHTRPAIEQGLRYLSEQAREDGSFGPDDSLRALHTVSVALVLQAASRLKLGSSDHSLQAKQALGWLQDHPDAAMRPVELLIEIDPHADGAGNYGFIFMTETLLLGALMASPDAAHHKSALARTALERIKDNWDPACGGCYGPAVFSWSTARTLASLAATSPHIQEFPRRQPERGTWSGLMPTLILATYVLLLIVIMYQLSQSDKFGLLEFSMITIGILSILLATRFISQEVFSHLFKFVKGWGGKEGR